MLSKGNISVGEVKRILRRHWWILPITMLCAGAIAFALTLVLPKKYTSATMVLVEPPTVTADVLPSAANEDLYRHLSSMKDQILSRSRLQPIITKFNVFPNSKEHIEDQVDDLQKMIEVELIQPMPGSINRQPPGFHIRVTLNNAQLAQQVCSEITSMFYEQNATTEAGKLRDTQEFLTQQLRDAKTNLDEQDEKLAQFKREHLGTLPEEEQSNLSLMTGMNSQLDATTQALSRAQQDKAFNESLLSQQQAAWKATQSGMGNTETLDQQLALAQDKLSELLAKYTPEHPDVVKTKAQIEDIKKRIATSADPKAATASASATPTHEPPQIQQMRARIKQNDLNIEDLTKHQAQIQKQIGVLQAHVQASPMVEQQMKELTRNYQTASDHYNDLLKNQEKSVMLTDLHNQQKGETYRVLDPPSLPTTPSFPKKPVFVGGGLGAGFVLGVGILYLLAMADKGMYSERDVELCLKLPVLTMVPSFDFTEVAHHQARRKDITVVPTKA